MLGLTQKSAIAPPASSQWYQSRSRPASAANPRFQTYTRSFDQQRVTRTTQLRAQITEVEKSSLAPNFEEGGVSGAEGELRADQLFDSVLPPSKGRATRVDQYREGLWAFTQPLPIPLVGDPDLRMTVARLLDGSLWIHSPVAPTGEVLAALAAIEGDVTNIVLPSISPEHWYFGPAMAAAFPNATVWVAPGLLEGKRLGWPAFKGKELDALKDTHTIKTLEDGAPAEWGGEVAVVILNTSALIEAALILRTSKALLVSDTLTMIDASYAPTMLGRKFSEVNGIWNKLGPQIKLLFNRYPTESLKWVNGILAEDFDIVVPAHAVSPVKDGKNAVRDCFQWLLKTETA